MTKVHEENFYTYQIDLLKADDFPNLDNAQPIVRQPNEPGGGSLWSGGVAAQRQIPGVMLRPAQGDVGESRFPPRRPDTIVRDPPPRGTPLKAGAESWLDAVRLWQEGLDALQRRRHDSAAFLLNRCQQRAIEYFDIVREIRVDADADVRARVLNILANIASTLDPAPQPATQGAQAPRTLRRMLELRRQATTLASLHFFDWTAPVTAAANVAQRPIVSPMQTPITRLNADAIEVLNHIAAVGINRYAPPGSDAALLAQHIYLVHQKLDYFMIVLMAVFVPLARAELERDRQRYQDAVSELEWVLANCASAATPDQYIVNDKIELPFIRLLLAECLLEQGDADYRAETPVSPLPPVPAPPARLVRRDWMKARVSYELAAAQLGLLGTYGAQVEAAVAKLSPPAPAPGIPAPDLANLGKEILIDSMRPALKPGETPVQGQERMVLLKNSPAAAPLLEIGDAAATDTNPRTFALLFKAHARLEQMKADFNWLGYSDDYTPPWRFQFLLDRARYFTEHAKQAQRDYLNFLSNAEREEFQEKSSAQTVALEHANIAVESARVDQVSAEAVAAEKGHDLSETVAQNAKDRAEMYNAFDEIADSNSNPSGLEFGIGMAGALFSGGAAGAAGGPPGVIVGALLGGLSFLGGNSAQQRQNLIQNAQRTYEYKSLGLAASEADKAVVVAAQQLEVAKAAVTVAMLQKQAALMRHAFAIETAAYLVNRKLNAEQWFRLANGIRDVADTYLRYAVEIAFLAEQAYEFEADKQLNVIRFDYDLSELGDYLAGDFLLRDLDTLEHDLIVSQRERQQHVRYVLSMAREFPEALQELRDTGRIGFSMVLEQIERRFPGLILARVGAVDILPVALMDQTRFSLRLTHQGFSRMRRRPAPGADPAAPWPAEPRVHGPETAIYSGLTRQDAASIFPIATSGQRNPFEGRGAAGAWEIDMSMEENQVVPGSIADMLITFNVFGFFDSGVQTEPTPPGPNALTSYISARQVFPDNFFEFHRSGRMVWKITRDLLTLSDTLGAVRNVAVLLLPAPTETNYGRIMSQLQVQVRITSSGDLVVDSEIPEITFSPSSPSQPLGLEVQAGLAGGLVGADLSWDFGDGGVFKIGAAQSHVYSKPGKYTVTLRVVRNGRLSEFRSDVVMSRAHANGLVPPLMAFPVLSPETAANVPAGRTRIKAEVRAQAADPVVTTWRIGNEASGKGSLASFDLPPGTHILHFRAVRMIRAHVYNRQQHQPEASLEFDGLHLTSNRRFDLDGTETTGTGANPPVNVFATHLLTGRTLSPVDDGWTVELLRSENPFLQSVTGTDNEQIDLGEIFDAVLALEYETMYGTRA
jgi:PKD repeat protein